MFNYRNLSGVNILFENKIFTPDKAKNILVNNKLKSNKIT